MSSRDDSHCPKGILCDFQLSRNLPDAQIEVCVQCSKKVVYQKISGEVDEAKYGRDHRRDTLQPYGKSGELYGKIYGFKQVKEFEKHLARVKTKKQQDEEWQEIRKESKDYVSKRILGSETRGTDWT